jgi:hypothetical protein
MALDTGGVKKSPQASADARVVESALEVIRRGWRSGAGGLFDIFGRSFIAGMVRCSI